MKHTLIFLFLACFALHAADAQTVQGLELKVFTTEGLQTHSVDKESTYKDIGAFRAQLIYALSDLEQFTVNVMSEDSHDIDKIKILPKPSGWFHTAKLKIKLLNSDKSILDDYTGYTISIDTSQFTYDPEKYAFNQHGELNINLDIETAEELGLAREIIILKDNLKVSTKLVQFDNPYGTFFLQKKTDTTTQLTLLLSEPQD